MGIFDNNSEYYIEEIVCQFTLAIINLRLPLGRERKWSKVWVEDGQNVEYPLGSTYVFVNLSNLWRLDLREKKVVEICERHGRTKVFTLRYARARKEKNRS